METIGFIGCFDKTDMIICLSKIFTTLNKKVLVIDATTNQKARYIVPTMNPTKTYITNFEDFDVAIGFKNMEDIKEYLSIQSEQQMEYDYIFIDTDNADGFIQFELNVATQLYFITSFDLYALKKGLEIFYNLSERIEMIKVLFAEQILKEDDEYLNYLSLNYKIKWNELRIYFPLENGDNTILQENQRLSKVKLKRISAQYKDSLSIIMENILGNTKASNIRRAIKSLD